MATGHSSFATLATTTLQNFANEIFDNVVTNNALLYELQKAGNIKVSSGGRQFTHPLLYAQNNTFGAIGKLGTISLAQQDNITRAVYDIKVVAGSVALSQVEMAMNAGDKEKLIDLVEEKKMEAEVAMTEVLGDQVFNTTAGSDDFDGIPFLINTAPSLQSTVGGIDSTGNSYWRNYIHATTVGTFRSTGTDGGLYAMDVCLNNSTFGRQGPKIIITTKAVWTLYQLTLTSNARYTDMAAADGGFKKLYYATLPVYFDDNCVSARMYFIDTSAIRLQVLSQGNMKMTAFEQSHTQLVQSCLLYLLGNLTCGSRRTNAVINSITG